VAAPGFLLGQAIGRIGDIINGEHLGAQAPNLPWAVVYTHPNTLGEIDLPVHPAVAYELLWDLAAAGLVVWLMHRWAAHPGAVLSAALLLYSVGRIWVGFFRLDQRVALGLGLAQLIGVAMLPAAATGLAMSLRAGRSPRRGGQSGEPGEGQPRARHAQRTQHGRPHPTKSKRSQRALARSPRPWWRGRGGWLALSALVALLAVGGPLAWLTWHGTSTRQPAATRQAIGESGTEAVGCSQMEQLAYHVHAHLAIFIEGQPVTVPANIGIHATCIAWLHTHATDGVIHVEAPASVASAIQRIGRAGHAIDVPSKGVILPKYRGDLLACAAIVEGMKEGAVEPLRY
jgi:hypothetical protein